MIIDIPAIPFDNRPLIWFFSILGGLVFLVVVGIILHAVDVDYDFILGGMSLAVGCIWIVAGGFSLIGGAATIHADKIEKAQIQSLQDKGFSQIELSDSEETFTASLDGEYFKGTLFELEHERSWQINEIVEVKR